MQKKCKTALCHWHAPCGLNAHRINECLYHSLVSMSRRKKSKEIVRADKSFTAQFLLPISNHQSIGALTACLHLVFEFRSCAAAMNDSRENRNAFGFSVFFFLLLRLELFMNFVKWQPTFTGNEYGDNFFGKAVVRICHWHSFTITVTVVIIIVSRIDIAAYSQMTLRILQFI